MSLRLGVTCAVIDDEGRVLLSKRDDLNVWNLPGGRLDSGELLADAAAREVHEETGVKAHIERPVNLYFWPGFQRLNVLYAGWPLGGALQARTDETRDNQYIVPESLPTMLHAQQVQAALADCRSQPDIITLSPADLRRMKRTLSLRWLKNLLRGRPEPKFPQFHVRAVAVIWDNDFRRVLTVTGKRGQTLPRVSCQGLRAPWGELQDRVRQHCKVNPALQWVGVWQDAPRNLLELVFAASVPEKPLPVSVVWTNIQNAALGDRDLGYVERVQPTYINDAVWSLVYDDEIGDTDTLFSRRANK